LTDLFGDIEEAVDLSRLAEELQLTPGEALKRARPSEGTTAGQANKRF
jgi:hypothetical protein